MNPKNKKYLVNTIVAETNMDEGKVETILTYYWKTIRAFLQNPTHTSIFLNKLGTFSLMSTSVDDYITDKQVFIDRMDKKLNNDYVLSEGQEQYYQRCVNDLIWLNERKKDLKEKKLKVKTKKQTRHEYIKSKADNQEIKLPLAEQKPNLKGILELALERWEDQDDSTGENKNMQD